MKKLFSKILAVSLSAVIAATVFAVPVSAGWVKLSGGSWRYTQQDGTYVRNRFEQIDGKWYMFNNVGNMVTGWYNLPGTSKWYYLRPDGSAVIDNWVYDFGGWYYIAANGIMATGWKQIDGEWYYLMQGGRMATGWRYIGGAWYWFDGDGSMRSNDWLQYQNDWYWLDASGKMAADCTLMVSGQKYTFGSDGAMVEETKSVDAAAVYGAMTEAVLAGHKGAESAVASPYSMSLSELGDAYGIDTSAIASFKGEMAMMMTNCDMMLVAEAKSGRVNEVKAAFEQILENRVAQFEFYSVMGNTERCQAAKVVSKGNHVALIMVGVYDNDTYDCAGDVSAAVSAFKKAVN